MAELPQAVRGFGVTFITMFKKALGLSPARYFAVRLRGQ